MHKIIPQSYSFAFERMQAHTNTAIQAHARGLSNPTMVTCMIYQVVKEHNRFLVEIRYI